VPEDIWNEFWERATMDDNWLGTDYEATNAAIVTIREFNPNVVSSYGPFLTTKWHQENPYNDSDPEKRKLGCVTIAVGQLMKYYQYPNSYNWSAMPNSIYTYNSTLCPFLYTLRQELKVDSEGGTTINEALRVLKEYGYDCNTISHNDTKVRNSLTKKYPVFASGTDKQRAVGHAWLIDGYRFENAFKLYTLYFIAGWKAEPDYEEIDSRKEYLSYGDYMYHHNWGWGGSHDGWFRSSSIGLYDSSGTYRNYSSNRSEIIINGY
ncbi:MAG: C10 family peptidase, partial [Muribaculum sp.]|nr:C10 family peptidase [Muribaculum sp.]